MLTTEDYVEQPPPSTGTTTTLVEQLIPPARREHPATGSDVWLVLAIAAVLIVAGVVALVARAAGRKP